MLSIWCMCAHSLSHVWLSVIMDCSPPSFFVHGIFQARILVWVAISYSRASSQPEDQTTYLMSPALADRFFTTVPPEKPNKSMAATYYCCYLSWESSTWSPSEKSYSFGTQMEYNLSDAFLDFPKDNLDPSLCIQLTSYILLYHCVLSHNYSFISWTLSVLRECLVIRSVSIASHSTEHRPWHMVAMQ